MPLYYSGREVPVDSVRLTEADFFPGGQFRFCGHAVQAAELAHCHTVTRCYAAEGVAPANCVGFGTFAA